MDDCGSDVKTWRLEDIKINPDLTLYKQKGN